MRNVVFLSSGVKWFRINRYLQESRLVKRGRRDEFEGFFEEAEGKRLLILRLFGDDYAVHIYTLQF